MTRLVLLLLLLSAAHADQTVAAWRGSGKPKPYATRTLADLGALPPAPKLDAYGGWDEAPTFDPPGFFRPRQVAGRWWLIDPLGRRWLSVGVVTVNPGSGPAATAALPKLFGDTAGWATQTAASLHALGFNSTGAWSADALLRAAPQRLAYCPIWNFMSSYGKIRGGTYQQPGHTGYPNDCIFCFDPQFPEFCAKHAAQLAATKDDPWLLGHFSDNELPFPKDSLEKYLALGAGDPGRREAERWSAAHGVELKHPTEAQREAWRAHVIDTYLSIVAAAIRQADPNHLFLGSRLHAGEKSSPEALKACGKWLDVVAINVYGVWTPGATFGEWERWSGKPVLVTEWYAKGADSGMPNLTGAGWTVKTQRERGMFYQNFVLGLLASKVCVGWHWFKYADNDPNDPKADPSNRDSNKGIVTAGLEPWRELQRAMSDLNQVVYPLTQRADPPR
jgi:hypothetical protein